MIRYTAEQKEQALKSMQEIGVVKTKEATGISVQTLYKWKSESTPEGEKKPAARKKNAAQQESVAAARKLLKEDDTLSRKLRQLESENAKLTETNQKLRKALTALLG